MSARETSRQIASMGLAVLGLLCAQLALAAGPATAFLGYGPSTSFGTAGSGNGQFTSPVGVAVDDSSGDVYVVDQGNNRVEKLDAEGKYLSQFNGSANPSFPAGFSAPTAVAVDNSTGGASKGDVYVVDAGHDVIDKFSATGAFVFELKDFPNPVVGVAVDQSGNVWVAESEIAGEEHGPVQEFNGAEKNAPIQTVKPEFKRDPGIAVDSEDNLYLVRGSGIVAKFNSEGLTSPETEEITNCECTKDLTIDSGTNNLIVDQGSSIARYTPPYEIQRRAPEETFGTLASSEGVAVNGATHTVYASQREADTVAIFKLALFPDVTTGETSEVQGTSAKLEGTVNPDGLQVSSCEFEYGLTTAYGQTSPCSSAPGSGAAPVAVSAQVGGLTPATNYHYRLVAANANGSHAGVDRTFTPSTAPLVSGTPSASFVGTQSAVLSASLNPENLETRYHFEYGPCPTLAGCVGVRSTPDEVSSAYGSVGTTQEASGLIPGTTYSYRLVASNEGVDEKGETIGGTAAGVESSFTTAPVTAPSGVTGGYSAVTATSAVVTGIVNPDGLPASYAFELGVYNGVSTQYGIVFSGSAGAGASPVEESLALSGLQPGTTYAYRITVSSGYIPTETHTTQGATATFTTAGLPSVLVPPSPLVQLSMPPIAFPKTSGLVKKKVVRRPKKKHKKHAKKKAER